MTELVVFEGKTESFVVKHSKLKKFVKEYFKDTGRDLECFEIYETVLDKNNYCVRFYTQVDMIAEDHNDLSISFIDNDEIKRMLK